MYLIQLRTFYEAANCASLTGASEKLCTSQPAISSQIITFIKELGLSQFARYTQSTKSKVMPVS